MVVDDQKNELTCHDSGKAIEAKCIGLSSKKEKTWLLIKRNNQPA